MGAVCGLTRPARRLETERFFSLVESESPSVQGPSKYSRPGKDEMTLLKRTIKSTKEILKKFARY